MVQAVSIVRTARAIGQANHCYPPKTLERQAAALCKGLVLTKERFAALVH